MKNLKAKTFRVKNLVSMTLITGFALLALTTACDDKIAPEKPKPEITTPPPQPPITPQPPVTKEAKIIFSPTDYNQTLKLSEVKRITDNKTYTKIIFYTDAYYKAWLVPHLGALYDVLLKPALQEAGDRGECQGSMRFDTVVDTTSNEVRRLKQLGFTVDYQKE